VIGEILELRHLLRNRTLSPAALRALQERKLRAVIRHAYNNVITALCSGRGALS